MPVRKVSGILEDAKLMKKAEKALAGEIAAGKAGRESPPASARLPVSILSPSKLVSGMSDCEAYHHFGSHQNFCT